MLVQRARLVRCPQHNVARKCRKQCLEVRRFSWAKRTAAGIAGVPAHRWQNDPPCIFDKVNKMAKSFDSIVKIGRTHLQDATPIRLGQEFSGYTAQVENAVTRAESALAALAHNLPIGGTAVGTGINTHPRFGRLVASKLSKSTGIRFKEATNHFEAQATRDCVCDAHGHLRTIAISLSKVASDIRFMGCGPRCGIDELELPAVQPGSSIMPGKVNPVLVESVMQVAMKVSGNDVAVGMGNLGGAGSMMELSLAMPMTADVLMESITIIGNVAGTVCRWMRVRTEG